MISNVRKTTTCIVIVLLCVFFNGCTKDRYQERADLIKDGASEFYKHLMADRVSDAVFENERIEALSKQSEARLLQRPGRMDNNEKTREWVLVKAAKETAAENWLALARYLVKKKEYDKARGTFQRVIETYQDKPFQSYADRAKNGLRDLDLILDPSKTS